MNLKYFITTTVAKFHKSHTSGGSNHLLSVKSSKIENQ